MSAHPVWLILLFGLFSAVILGGTYLNVGEEQPGGPEGEYNVTCYKWVENGTAMVTCPDRVYAPNSWVNITVKPCSEYKFANDEPHPCGDYA